MKGQPGINRVFFLGLLLVIVSSCEKLNLFSDPRDKYVGKYQVVETFSYYGYNAPTPSVTKRDTFISVHYGSKKETIAVLGLDIELDKNGYYSFGHDGVSISNDSISTWRRNGGLGAGRYETYRGIRVSRKP